VARSPVQQSNNSLHRWRAPDDPERQSADREAREERLSRHIRDLIDKWPPLTGEQRDRLAALLRGGESA
jgi:hypothetical protein